METEVKKIQNGFTVNYYPKSPDGGYADPVTVYCATLDKVQAALATIFNL